ncbi:hypothetical protein FF38_09106 [Lucilia cuprina]|uniref:MD-2-related lipid-recognition domain-containing protein n=1 Tax=Lucilia cuprina TaxID=7375 RepID=A0A0L0BSV3_LUCCU|nr:hypothetical protein FF38_09106 [Lucilia cuprina]
MKFLLCLTIIISTNKIVLSWRPFNVHLTDVTCFSNSSKISYINCSIGVDSYKGGLNFNVKFKEEIDKAMFNVLLNIKRNNQPDFVLINTSFDACSFVENSNIMQMLKLMRDEVYLYSENFPKECPVKKNTEVNIKNLYFKADNLPSYVPECRFSLTYKLWQAKETLLETTIMGSVENKQKLRKKPLKNNTN